MNRDSGKSIAVVAWELDLTESAVRSWVHAWQERDILKTLGHGVNVPICWTRNSRRVCWGGTPGAVAVHLW